MPAVPEAVTQALEPEFEVLRMLGSGNTAEVYLARERALGRLVAIKVLRAELAADETASRRFEREARAAASLTDHPDVVAVYRYGRLPDGTPFLVMRYIKGRTLHDRMAAEGRLPVAEARRALRHVASALAAAHTRGIVHRDVRAGNVFWDDAEDRAYLSDFGIAGVLETSALDASPLTLPGMRVGNPKYLSPEQLGDEPLTAQADIYGFGMLGFELLTGEAPYDARGTAAWIRAHLSGEPRDLRALRPEVPAELAEVIMRCLAREPNHRPRAADLVRILGDMEGEGSPQPASDPGDVAELLRRRVPQVVLLAVAFGVGLVGFVSALTDRYDVPEWIFDFSIATAVAGLLASAVVAWFHGEKGPQQATRLEYALLGAIGAAWLAAGVILFTRG